MGLSASRQDGFTLESLLQYVSVGAPWGLDGQPLKLPDLAGRSSRAFSLIVNPAHELYVLSPIEENMLILLLGSGVILFSECLCSNVFVILTFAVLGQAY